MVWNNVSMSAILAALAVVGNTQSATARTAKSRLVLVNLNLLTTSEIRVFIKVLLALLRPILLPAVHRHRPGRTGICPPVRHTRRSAAWVCAAPATRRDRRAPART